MVEKEVDEIVGLADGCVTVLCSRTSPITESRKSEFDINDFISSVISSLVLGCKPLRYILN